MPYQTVQDTELYYETFGKRQAGAAPVLLIHGATGTGRSDWGEAAHLLALQHFVIVPDCRGHGRSGSAGDGYSFRGMATDAVELASKLGFPRCHIVGHSNGGNTALVLLLEHPEAVQTAVLQAANAYVSPDLLEREPWALDPERIARERPEWKEEMIALHGETHGVDYWRTLLEETLAEILREPNYTPQALAAVAKPVLVIQGQQDEVNAPARHAQFISSHVPDAELWVPEGVGHNVHKERLVEWVERLEDFWRRRGDDKNDVLYRLQRARYADERTTVFDLRAVKTPGGMALTGRVLEPVQLQEAQAAIHEQNRLLESSRVQVLLSEAAPWALVRRTVTDLRREPRSLAERVSQALLGEAVRVLESGPEWSFVRLECDGYLGWIHSRALLECQAEAAAEYRQVCDSIVAEPLAPAWRNLSAVQSGQLAGKLPFGARVVVGQRRAGYGRVDLPDGRQWWTPEAGLLRLAQVPGPTQAGIALVLELVQRCTGTPYLWGGRTPFGFDCSGLAQAFYGFLGVQIPRDADQQFAAGSPVEGAPEPGDLLFFGEEDEKSRRSITHVAISLGGSEMIHSNGTDWGVSANSLEPASPIYSEWLAQHLAGVRRLWV